MQSPPCHRDATAAGIPRYSRTLYYPPAFKAHHKRIKQGRSARDPADYLYYRLALSKVDFICNTIPPCIISVFVQSTLVPIIWRHILYPPTGRSGIAYLALAPPSTSKPEFLRQCPYQSPIIDTPLV